MIEIRNVPRDPNDKTVLEVRHADGVTRLLPGSATSVDVNASPVTITEDITITDTPPAA